MRLKTKRRLRIAAQLALLFMAAVFVALAVLILGAWMDGEADAEWVIGAMLGLIVWHTWAGWGK